MAKNWAIAIGINEYDYLMPSDGNSADIEDTAIPINFVTERLRRCGADNVVLIIDACRQVGTRGEGIGRQTASMARQTGVITIFSCSANEYSYEIEALQQGVSRNFSLHRPPHH